MAFTHFFVVAVVVVPFYIHSFHYITPFSKNTYITPKNLRLKNKCAEKPHNQERVCCVAVACVFGVCTFEVCFHKTLAVTLSMNLFLLGLFQSEITSL